LAAGAFAAGVGGLQYAASIDQATSPEASQFTVDVWLASTEFALPLNTGTADIWFLGGGNGPQSLIGTAANAPLTVFASSANGPLSGRPAIGDGGWLIGNGLNAAADCQDSACNGGNGGLLGGSGGGGGDGDTADSIGGPVTGGNGGRGGDGKSATSFGGGTENQGKGGAGGRGGIGGTNGAAGSNSP
jgi:hypothetical protein